MHVSVRKYIMHSVYVLHVPATCVGIFIEMPYHRIYFNIVLPAAP